MRLLTAILFALALAGCGADDDTCARECACRTTATEQHRCLMHCGINGHGDCVCRPH